MTQRAKRRYARRLREQRRKARASAIARPALTLTIRVNTQSLRQALAEAAERFQAAGISAAEAGRALGGWVSVERAGFSYGPEHGELMFSGMGTVAIGIPRQPETPQSKPSPCNGCANYHGHGYGHAKLHCAMHPYGPEGENCEDWEGRPRQESTKGLLVVSGNQWEFMLYTDDQRRRGFSGDIRRVSRPEQLRGVSPDAWRVMLVGRYWLSQVYQDQSFQPMCRSRGLEVAEWHEPEEQWSERYEAFNERQRQLQAEFDAERASRELEVEQLEAWQRFMAGREDRLRSALEPELPLSDVSSEPLLWHEVNTRPLYYCLEGRTPVPSERALNWDESWRVAETFVGDVRISTVFLGRDWDWAGGLGPASVFETMVFGGHYDEWCERYATWEQAEAGHREAVAMVESRQRAFERWRTPLPPSEWQACEQQP